MLKKEPFFLKELEETKETFTRSKSIIIVHQILQGRSLTKDVWEYLRTHEDVLGDVMIRLPTSRTIEHKKMIKIALEKDLLNENKLRFFLERFVSSEELSKYLLDGYFKSIKEEKHNKK